MTSVEQGDAMACEDGKELPELFPCRSYPSCYGFLTTSSFTRYLTEVAESSNGFQLFSI